MACLLGAGLLWPAMARAADLEVWADGRATLGGQAYRCVLGRSGVLAAKREGDGATPAGAFPLRRVLYRPDVYPTAPVTGLPARALSPDDGWCDDVGLPQYNRPVKLPFAGSHEELWRRDRLYDLVVVVGYNDDPVAPGLGSAIFLHVARPDRSPTAGCVAFAAEDLLAILAWLGPGSRVVIHP